MEHKIVEVELPNGAVVLVRAADVEGGRGATKTAWADRFDFHHVANALEGLAGAIASALAKAAPNKVRVELGIELIVKSGGLTALLVDGEGKGSFTLALEWVNDGSGGT